MPISVRTMPSRPETSCSSQAAPNSGQAIIQHLSLFGAVKNAFCTSAPRTSRSFKAATNNNIRTESLATTELYVADAGAPVLWPSAPYHALRRKFSPSLTSKTRCPVIWVYPTSELGSPSKSSNATLTFFISNLMASIHKVLPAS